jgi:hypothetical protein
MDARLPFLKGHYDEGPVSLALLSGLPRVEVPLDEAEEVLAAGGWRGDDQNKRPGFLLKLGQPYGDLSLCSLVDDTRVVSDEAGGTWQGYLSQARGGREEKSEPSE